MGNIGLRCTAAGAGALKKARVLLPDGNIILLDAPFEAADLMLEYVNHMVVQCATVGSTMGKRTSMAIMQPHERLQPGQAYVIYPIPAQSQKKTKLRPQPLSVPNRNSSGNSAAPTATEKKYEKDDKKPEREHSCKQKFQARVLQRFQGKVADSSQSEDGTQSPSRTSQLSQPGSPLRSHSDADAKKMQKDWKDYEENDFATDDEDDKVVFNVNMYMGWRPALESIPESPLGYNHSVETMQQAPLLVA